ERGVGREPGSDARNAREGSRRERPSVSAAPRDVLIVGAGPAGVSAALAAHALGLQPRIIESAPAAGGQLLHVHFHPADLAGRPDGDGPAIAAAMAPQLAEARIPTRWGTA